MHQQFPGKRMQTRIVCEREGIAYPVKGRPRASHLKVKNTNSELLDSYGNLQYQFFLQVKQDILQGRLPVTFDLAAELGSYVVQCE
uniref:FERM domain-containing protein n=1 Tax=Timema shepardi TaxID=629360 RepID=A0A7R9FVG9_TIMSH|nr:unnamed protein product [Timema shepardi]